MPADYVVLIDNIDTSQQYHAQKVEYLCISCAYQRFMSKDGQNVRNYIKISNNKAIPDKLQEFQEINYNLEEQDIWIGEIQISLPIFTADKKMGKIVYRTRIDIREAFDKMIDVYVKDIIQAIKDCKYKIGRHPVLKDNKLPKDLNTG